MNIFLINKEKLIFFLKRLEKTALKMRLYSLSRHIASLLILSFLKTEPFQRSSQMLHSAHRRMHTAGVNEVFRKHMRPIRKGRKRHIPFDGMALI